MREAPLRVLFYDHCALMSGAEISMLNTLSALDADRTVVLGEHGPLMLELQGIGVTTSVLPLPAATREFSRRRVALNLASLAQPFRVLAYARRLAALINSHAPDVVISNSMKAHVLLSAARPLLRAPLVFWLHDRVSTDFLSPAGVRLERALIKRVPRALIANSRSTLDTAPPSRRHRARRIIGGPIGPLPDGLQPVPARAGVARRFGMVGRISPWKGQHLAITAFASAFPDGDETLEIVGGVLFGEHDYRREIERLVSDLGLADRVRFTGHVDDVYVRMQSWDALIHASVIPEPFGLVVAQGMLSGLPVIASGEGGPAEIIRDGVDGYLFTPRSADALTAVLRTVAQDGQDRARVAREATAAVDRYLPAAVASAVDEVLRTVVGAPARTGRGTLKAGALS